MTNNTRPDGTVAFCVGTGRCGTTFITELLGLEPDVAASHERLRLAACYHMFCKWHGIPSDSEGFLADRDLVVANDLTARRISFEASALLSHSVAELYERFDARFLLLVRRPDACVASFAVRGWFLEPIAWRDRSKPPTIPDAANVANRSSVPSCCSISAPKRSSVRLLRSRCVSLKWLRIERKKPVSFPVHAS